MSATTKRAIEEYDPVLKRWRVQCPYCSYTAVRSKKDASRHVMSQHVAYTHQVSA